MADMAIIVPEDGELSDDDLAAVTGGLARAWIGAWEAAELGPAPAPAATADGAARDSTA
jgi:hypothetical protein